SGRSLLLLDPEGDYRTLAELERGMVFGGKGGRALPPAHGGGHVVGRPARRGGGAGSPRRAPLREGRLRAHGAGDGGLRALEPRAPPLARRRRSPPPVPGRGAPGGGAAAPPRPGPRATP